MGGASKKSAKTEGSGPNLGNRHRSLVLLSSLRLAASADRRKLNIAKIPQDSAKYEQNYHKIVIM